MPTPPEWLLSLRQLPQAHSLVLTVMVSLLAVADWLPTNAYVDSDILEFLLSMAFGLSAVGVAVVERLDADELAVWRNRMVATVLALIVAVIGAEFATRYVFRNITTTADSGGYFTLRWERALRENVYGMRERGFSPVKPAGVYRIAVEGDSFTFGNGLPEDQRYSNLLQRWLPASFEVLNFGFPAYLSAHFSDPNGDAAQRERALLHDIVEAAHSNGAGFGLVLFPDAGYDLGGDYPFAYLHQRVGDACREEQIPCLDLREDFAKVKDRRSLWVNPLDHHPSARANEIAAIEILRVFEPYWIK